MTQTVPDISPLMPMHQDPLLVTQWHHNASRVAGTMEGESTDDRWFPNIGPIMLSFRMMTSSNGNIFRVTGPLCGEFIGHRWIPQKGQWLGAWLFSLIFAWINGWVNNREAGVLRLHRAHYDVIVMWFVSCVVNQNKPLRNSRIFFVIWNTATHATPPYWKFPNK